MEQHGPTPHLTRLRALLIGVSVGGCLAFASTSSGQGTGGTTLGHQACAECHQTEFAAWKQSPHATQSFQLLEHPDASDFAAAIGATGDLSQSACANCHATEPQNTTANGVSCESCHGPAGPEEGGWFKIHSQLADGQNINPTMVDLLSKHVEESAEHRKMRLDACDAAGMNRSAEVYDIAKNCLSCHTVAVDQMKDAEKLVNAGHPTTKNFEMVRYSQGSVRHNFLLDQKTNAESPSLWLAVTKSTPENRKKLMFVTGQLVDLEVSLRSRGQASKGDYADAVNERIEDAIGELEDLEHIAEVKQVLDMLGGQGINEDRLEEFKPTDQQDFNNAAGAVQGIAKQFVRAHEDGSGLGDFRVSSRSEGDPYEP